MNISINLEVKRVPKDYDSKECNLCSNLYKDEISFHNDIFCVWQNLLYKKKNENLFTCCKCVYLNWHKLEEWQPYII